MARATFIEQEVEVIKREKRKTGVTLHLDPREVKTLFILLSRANGPECHDIYNELDKICPTYDYDKINFPFFDLWTNANVQKYINEPLKGD